VNLCVLLDLKCNGCLTGTKIDRIHYAKKGHLAIEVPLLLSALAGQALELIIPQNYPGGLMPVKSRASVTNTSGVKKMDRVKGSNSV
jgi:hypothetical protein